MRAIVFRVVVLANEGFLFEKGAGCKLRITLCESVGSGSAETKVAVTLSVKLVGERWEYVMSVEKTGGQRRNGRGFVFCGTQE